VDHLLLRLDLPPPAPERRSQLVAYLTTNPSDGSRLDFELGSQAAILKIAGLVHLLATDPAYQVG